MNTYNEILKILNEDVSSYIHLMNHDRERIAKKINNKLIEAKK